jgi:hypothetical protein
MQAFLLLELSFLGTRCTCEDVQLSPLPVVLLSKPEHVPASCLIYMARVLMKAFDRLLHSWKNRSL